MSLNVVRAPRIELTVVGCGVSAVLLLAALARQSLASSRLFSIRLFDANPLAPRGLAYGSVHPFLTLNVPAQRMGAYADDPGDFFRWLQKCNHWQQLFPEGTKWNPAADDFVPRALYGDYLNYIFHQSIQQLKSLGHRVVLEPIRVAAIKPGCDQNPLRVITTANTSRAADVVVLATGNRSAWKAPVSDQTIFASPFKQSFQKNNWHERRELVIIGSGLAMVDAVQTAVAQGFRGRFQIYSGHALLPLPHHHQQSAAALPGFKANALTAIGLLRDARAFIRANQHAGIPWQSAINELRAVANSCWGRLSDAQVVRIRKLLPWWNIARHRIPAELHQRLMNLKETQRLTLHKAKVVQVARRGNCFHLMLASGEVLQVEADNAVICTGYQSGFDRARSLCGGLLDNENKLRAKFANSSSDYRVSTGQPIYALGPALGGLVFETTAIHEIRMQAAAIAEAILTNAPPQTRLSCSR